tara:strand:+ start:2626 stop:2748 length:123 start_codon:yes stop_codon:yes gene_type:complete
MLIMSSQLVGDEGGSGVPGVSDVEQQALQDFLGGLPISFS